MADKAELWAGDKLGRKEDAAHLLNVLINRYEAKKAAGIGSYILNIDAAWGEGKTYFLRNFRDQLKADGYAVAYVNAWEDDHADDPLTTVMVAIEDELLPHMPKSSVAGKALGKAKAAAGVIAAETVKQVGFHFLKLSTGIAVDKTLAAMHEQGALETSLKLDDEKYQAGADKVLEAASEAILADRVEGHRKAQKSVGQFRTKLSEAVANITPGKVKEPFFVFVDELDRCRPLYAIRMLEDMKHLFATKGVVFVVATDTVQLSHSVSAIYGERFEGARYLRRFFDRVFVFPEADRTKFVAHVLEQAGIDPLETFYKTGMANPLQIISSWVEAFEYSNRDLEQVLEILITFVTSWNHESKIEPVTLLANISAFYASPTTKYGRDLKTPFPQMGGWMIKNFRTELGSGEGVKTGAAIFEALESQSRNPLVDMNYSNAYTSQYFHYETKQRFPNGMNIRSPERSLLVEYTRRVRDAGRHLDPDATKSA